MFLQFIAVKLPCQSFYKNNNKIKNSEEGKEKRKSGHLPER